MFLILNGILSCMLICLPLACNALTIKAIWQRRAVSVLINQTASYRNFSIINADNVVTGQRS